MNAGKPAEPLAGADATVIQPASASASASASAFTPGSVTSPRSICVYLALVFGLVPLWPQSEALAAALVLVAVIASWRDLKPVPRAVLLAVVTTALMALAWAPQLLVSAALATARLSALVIGVMLLSATLVRSRGLEDLAAGLIRGRALPRYFAVAGATGVLALPLNFGSVGVMCAVIARMKQRSGDNPPARNAARAALRGFGAASLGSPLSISLAITLTLLPGSTVHGLLAISLPFALAYVLLGAAFREPEPPSSAVESGRLAAAPAAVVWRSWLRFAAWILAICLTAFSLYGAFDMPYAHAVAIACVSAAFASVVMARRRGDPAGAPAMGSSGNELAVMSGSAFLGVIASGAGLSALGPGFSIPAAAWPLVAFCIPWLIYAGGMLGLNPIVTGTLCGAMLGPLAPPGTIDGIGFAILAGWSMTVAGTPYSANSMLLHRITGYDAHVAAFQWNLRLSLTTLTAAGLLAAVLTLA